MTSLGRFVLFGAALAFIIGATFVRSNTPPYVVVLIALAITALSTFIYLYKPKSRRAAGTPKPGLGLVPGTKPWAEELYRQGFISQQELDDFLKSLQP